MTRTSTQVIDFDPDLILKEVDSKYTGKFGFTFGPTPKKVPEHVFAAAESKIKSMTYNDWRDDLLQNGFAVVKNAISREKAKEYQKKAFEWAISFGTELDFEKPETWIKENIPDISNLNIFFSNAVAHERFMWDIRTEPGVMKAFSDIYGTDELLVSFDSLNITFPNRRDKEPIKSWPHVDQSPFKKGLECIQGIVSLSNHGSNDGGLVVYKGSHNYFSRFFEREVGRENWNELDYYALNQDGIKFMENKGCKEIKICCEPGDLILWDSRLIHWGKEPDKTSDEIRTVVYVSYSPRYFATEQALEYKKKAFQSWSSTTHWSHDNIICQSNVVYKEDGSVDPSSRTKPRELPKMNIKTLQLAGMIPY